MLCCALLCCVPRSAFAFANALLLLLLQLLLHLVGDQVAHASGDAVLCTTLLEHVGKLRCRLKDVQCSLFGSACHHCPDHLPFCLQSCFASAAGFAFHITQRCVTLQVSCVACYTIFTMSACSKWTIAGWCTLFFATLQESCFQALAHVLHCVACCGYCTGVMLLQFLLSALQPLLASFMAQSCCKSQHSPEHSIMHSCWLCPTTL